VRNFDEWKKQEASIKKGEKALNILVPVQLEKGGEERTYFQISRVFDVSQTTAEPSPDAPAAVTDSMVQALLQSVRTEAVINDNLPEFFTERFNSATNTIELRPDLKENIIATIARPVAMAYRQQRGKPSDSHLATLTAAILAYRIDPSAQIIRESPALCIDHVTPNDAKELRALLTEAAKDAKELHSSYLIHHRELAAKKKTRDVER